MLMCRKQFTLITITLFRLSALLQFNEQEEARSVVLQHWYKYVFGPISVGQHCCRPTNNVGWLYKIQHGDGEIGRLGGGVSVRWAYQAYAYAKNVQLDRKACEEPFYSRLCLANQN